MADICLLRVCSSAVVTTLNYNNIRIDFDYRFVHVCRPMKMFLSFGSLAAFYIDLEDPLLQCNW